MADVVVRATQPTLAAIKLAWWRERLEELDQGKVPSEPRLQTAARELLPRRVSGADLAAIEDGWASLLEQTPDISRVERRGVRLFALGARLLGISSAEDTIDAAGGLFARVDAARRGLVELAPEPTGIPASHIPRRARPLTGLAALAARDLRRGGPPFEHEATPGRAWTLMRHRLTGGFPR